MPETQGLIEQLGALSYIGTFLTAFLANVVIPVPEEIVMIAFGYVMSLGKLSPILVAPLIVLGLLTSDIVMYLLARRGSRLVEAVYRRLFKSWIGDKEAWLTTHLKKVVFISRFLVQLRFIGPFLAGQKKMPFLTFLFYDFLAIVVYVSIYVSIGWYFHNRIQYIADGINTAKNIIILVFVLILVFVVSKGIRRTMFGKKKKTKK